MWVEEEGHKRRGLEEGKERGEILLGIFAPDIDINGNHKRSKRKCKVTYYPDHTLQA